jgi:hypothetical protein
VRSLCSQHWRQRPVVDVLNDDCDARAGQEAAVAAEVVVD